MTAPVSKRPVYLDPLKIRFPVTASASLAHRVSGVLLAIVLPILVWALSKSLAGPDDYRQIAAVLTGGPQKIVLLVLTWALAHHVAAGVRHLLFDMGIGTDLATARQSAWAVHALALAVTLLAAGTLW